MNGNFEQDNGAYPYGVQYSGSGVYVVYVPTQERLYTEQLPIAVGSIVALRLNTVYHSKTQAEEKRRTLDHLLRTLHEVVIEAARSAYDNKHITGEVYTQIKIKAEG